MESYVDCVLWSQDEQHQDVVWLSRIVVGEAFDIWRSNGTGTIMRKIFIPYMKMQRLERFTALITSHQSISRTCSDLPLQLPSCTVTGQSAPCAAS